MPLISIGESETGTDGFKAMLKRRVQAVGYTAVADETGMSRETIYRMLGKRGNPRLQTVRSLCRALGVSLVVRAKKA